MKFSTFDNDNDRVDGSCALSYHGGWWYNECHCANPNGLYLRGATDQLAKGMTYAPFRSQYYSLKSVTLMVRRIV